MAAQMEQQSSSSSDTAAAATLMDEIAFPVLQSSNKGAKNRDSRKQSNQKHPGQKLTGPRQISKSLKAQPGQMGHPREKQADNIAIDDISDLKTHVVTIDSEKIKLNELRTGRKLLEIVDQIMEKTSTEITVTTSRYAGEARFFMRGRLHNIDRAVAWLETLTGPSSSQIEYYPLSLTKHILGRQGRNLQDISAITAVNIILKPTKLTDESRDGLKKLLSRSYSLSERLYEIVRDTLDNTSQDEKCVARVHYYGNSKYLETASKMIKEQLIQLLNYVTTEQSYPRDFIPLIAAKMKKNGSLTKVGTKQKSRFRYDIPSLSNKADDNKAIFQGSKTEVDNALKIVDNIYQDLQRFTTNIQFSLPHQLHALIRGTKNSNLKTIIDTYDCCFSFPPIGTKSPEIVVRGPLDKLGAAIQAGLDAAGASTFDSIDMCQLLGIRLPMNDSDRQYLQAIENLLRSCKILKNIGNSTNTKLYRTDEDYGNRPKMRQWHSIVQDDGLQKTGKGNVEVSSENREEALPKDSSGSDAATPDQEEHAQARYSSEHYEIFICGKSIEDVTNARDKLINEFKNIPTKQEFRAIKVTPKAFGQIIGNRGQNLQKTKLLFGVNIVLTPENGDHVFIYVDKSIRRSASDDLAINTGTSQNSIEDQPSSKSTEHLTQSAPSHSLNTKEQIEHVSLTEEEVRNRLDDCVRYLKKIEEEVLIFIRKELDVPLELHSRLIGKGGSSLAQISDIRDGLVNIEFNRRNAKVILSGPNKLVESAADDLLKHADKVSTELKIHSFEKTLSIDRTFIKFFKDQRSSLGTRNISQKFKVKPHINDQKEDRPVSSFVDRNKKNTVERFQLVLIGIQENVHAAEEFIKEAIRDLKKEQLLEIVIPHEFHPQLIGSGGRISRRLCDRYDVNISFGHQIRTRWGHISNGLMNIEGPKDAASEITMADKVFICGTSKRNTETAKQELLELYEYEKCRSHTATIAFSSSGPIDHSVLQRSRTRIDEISQRNQCFLKWRSNEITLQGTQEDIAKSEKEIRAVLVRLSKISRRKITIEHSFHRWFIGAEHKKLQELITKAEEGQKTSGIETRVIFPRNESDEVILEGVSNVIMSLEKVMIEHYEYLKQQRTLDIVIRAEDIYKLQQPLHLFTKRLRKKFGIAVTMEEMSSETLCSQISPTRQANAGSIMQSRSLGSGQNSPGVIFRMFGNKNGVEKADKYLRSVREEYSEIVFPISFRMKPRILEDAALNRKLQEELLLDYEFRTPELPVLASERIARTLELKKRASEQSRKTAERSDAKFEKYGDLHDTDGHSIHVRQIDDVFEEGTEMILILRGTKKNTALGFERLRIFKSEQASYRFMRKVQTHIDAVPRLIGKKGCKIKVIEEETSCKLKARSISGANTDGLDVPAARKIQSDEVSEQSIVFISGQTVESVELATRMTLLSICDEASCAMFDSDRIENDLANMAAGQKKEQLDKDPKVDKAGDIE